MNNSLVQYALRNGLLFLIDLSAFLLNQSMSKSVIYWKLKTLYGKLGSYGSNKNHVILEDGLLKAAILLCGILL